MLRDPKQWCQRPLSRVAKVCLVTLLAAAGLLASGLRGPIGNVVQSASAAPVDVNASRASGEVSRAEVGLQDLVKRAKDKSVVNIPVGTYSSTLTLDRAMTLKGENAEKCIVEVTADAPAISVAMPKPVILDSLTIRWQLATSESQQGAACAIFLKDAAVTLRNCRIIAAGGSKRCPSAVQAVGFSKVTIENCRFEGFDFTVSYSEGAEGTITDSVFIQPGHCGITVMEGSKLNVARNIITRSEYHGLRSTGGTVIARDNLIVSNKNRGVYLGNRSAHGKLTNNVLLDNATGISAFGQSDVTIENNLILDSGYAGLDTRDSCAIGVRNNLFQGNPRGLVLVAESGKSKVKIGRNSFWENQTNAENFELPKGSILVDPQLTAPKQGDFAARAEEIVKNKQGLSNPKVFTALWEKWQQISKEAAE